MKTILIRVIPHDQQRYRTVGDYLTDHKDGLEQFRISDMGNEKYEHLVAVHELVERIICYHTGVTNEAIDKFDMDFESAADLNKWRIQHNSEPGDDPKAPYYHAHQIATVIERLLAAELGVNWNEYEKRINEL